MRHDGAAVLTALSDDVRHLALRPATPPLAVGDWVAVDEHTVVDMLPRASLLQRMDPSTGLDQPLVANVDVVLVVCGLDRPLKPGRIHRAVTQAWDAGAVPMVVLTKADLSRDVEADLATARDADPSVDVIAVSAATGPGLAQVAEAATDRTIVLLGESGAGKSTLVNALVADEVAAVGDVRAGDAKGRHTTTARQLHLLPNGGCLIDTPGLRALGLWTDAGTVDAAFDDIAAVAQGCRFRDCQHDTEPGCAVRAAVEAGELSADRLESWRELRKEARSAELRADEHARRQAEKRFARVVKEAKRHKPRR